MKTCGLLLLLVGVGACGGTSTPLLGDGGADDAGGGADAASDAPPEASTVPLTLSTCAAFTPCGGDVEGTWTLTGGCLDDPLATSKGLCPTLVVNSEVANASGTVTFTKGVVTRGYQTHYGIDITIPSVCLQGATCDQAQTAYRAYIPNATCTAASSGGCECVGSIDTTATQGSTYTIANDEIVTAGGDHYAYCITGNTMQYRHASGPNPELGSYTLEK